MERKTKPTARLRMGSQTNTTQKRPTITPNCHAPVTTTTTSQDWIYQITPFGIRPFSNTNPSLARFAHAANTLLSTVNINKENIHEWAVLDSDSTSHFLVINTPVI